jgi:acetyl-CoA carboxylase biotin carboxylase subunit
MKLFKKILVANRGEIALRVLRTCRRLGLATVAVYSDADQDSPHVRFADEAVRIGPPPALDSYLDPNQVLAAAWATGAQAIHPGYGFLAENEEFAAACESAGLVFVGPPAQAIRLMGSKIESRRLMEQSGVPVTPGYNGEDQSDAALRGKILEIGFPVIIKASAGGGGKGMLVVHQEREIGPALDQARRLARSAFGDDTLLLERYISPIRHVEIQILGDRNGKLLHVFERECSIQRRHQKIIEETPSPALTPELREAMGSAAVAAGRAVGYSSAGTVEFLLDPKGRFYFLEMNTRLQVEHPITEMVTGLDLVEQQLNVAMDLPLPFEQQELRQSGHAIECRLYAEDPENDFLPCTGTIHDWFVPELAGLRVDAGVQSGSEVGIFYDPMLAKIVTHAPTRIQAVQRMMRALEGLAVQGLTTNREFLLRVLEHPEFLAGNLSTHFIQDHLPPASRKRELHPEAVPLSCLAALLFAHAQRQAGRQVLPRLLPGWRNSRFRDQAVAFRVRDTEHRVQYRALAPGRFAARVDGGVEIDLRLLEVTERTVRFSADGVQRTYRVARAGADLFVHSALGDVRLHEMPRFTEAGRRAEAGSCVSPMPGKIRRLLVEPGQAVKKGEALLVLEAMKMEHTVAASSDGSVEALLVAEGEQVQADQVLVRLAAPAAGKG